MLRLERNGVTSLLVGMKKKKKQEEYGMSETE